MTIQATSTQKACPIASAFARLFVQKEPSLCDVYTDNELRAIREDERDYQARRERLLENSYLSRKHEAQYHEASSEKAKKLREKHAAKKLKPKPKRKPRPQPPADATEAELAELQAGSEERWKRIEAGLRSRTREYEFIQDPTFIWTGETVAERWVYPFVESGLRSEKCPAIRRFVQITDRRGRIQVGYRKDFVYRSRSKLLGLNMPFVRINSKIVYGFRTEIDNFFPHLPYLERQLRELLPVMPDLIVYDRCLGSTINRPHLWFFLPIGSSVWNDPDDPRFRGPPMKLFRSVMAAIVDRLAPLGADPGGLANPFHGKNPASPLWQTRALNDGPNLSLQDWKRELGLARTDERANELRARQFAERQSGLKAAVSNAIFNASRAWGLEIIRGMHDAGGERYEELLRDRDEFAQALLAALKERLAESEFSAAGAKAERVIKSVARYTAGWWKPERATGPVKLNGRMGKLTGTPEERMAKGAEFTAALRRETSIDRLAAAAVELRAEGVKLTRRAIAQRAGVDPRTASKHYQAALKAAEEKSAFRAVVKRLPSTPPQDQSSTKSDETAQGAVADAFEKAYCDASGKSAAHYAARRQQIAALMLQNAPEESSDGRCEEVVDRRSDRPWAPPQTVEALEVFAGSSFDRAAAETASGFRGSSLTASEDRNADLTGVTLRPPTGDPDHPPAPRQTSGLPYRDLACAS